MSLTLQDALSRIGTEGYTGLAGLQRLVAETSAVAKNAANGALTLLYSGDVGDVKGWQAATNISDHSLNVDGQKQIITIDDTDRAALLNDKYFQEEFLKATGNNQAEYARLLDGKDLNGNRISNDSLWDMASRDFARSAPGDFMTLTPFANEKSVFSQSEMSAILNSPELHSRQVNGIMVEDLRRLQTEMVTRGLPVVEAQRNVTQYVNEYSRLQTQNLKYEFDSAGRLSGVGTQEYFKSAGLSGLATERSADLLGRPAGFPEITGKASEQTALREFANMHEQVKSFAQERLASLEARGAPASAIAAAREGANRANSMGIVAGLMLIGSEAMGAQLEGDPERAQAIVSEGLKAFAESALLFGGIELVAGIIGSIVGLPLGAIVGTLLAAYGAYEAIKMLPELFDSLNRLYLQARGWQMPRRDPLALDLDGDGIETIATGTVVFDHDGDGLKTGSGWLKGDDGWLVWDKNGNGNIDSGRELFGEDYVKSNGQKAASGFDALSDLDSNQDGLFSSLDSPFNSVRVWRDLNQDGLSQANELNTLSQLNIASISLSSTAYAIGLGNGNVQTAQGNFTRTDGSTGKAVNLDLSGNPFYREFPNHLDTSASLPNMQGSGAVRDLRANEIFSRRAVCSGQSRLSSAYRVKQAA